MRQRVHAKAMLQYTDIVPYITEIVKREPGQDVTLLKYDLLSLEEMLARRVGMRLSGAGYDVDYIGPRNMLDLDIGRLGHIGYRLRFCNRKSYATLDMLCVQIPPAWKASRDDPPIGEFELTGYRTERIVIPGKRTLFWRTPEKVIEQQVPLYREPLSPTWIEGHSSFFDPDEHRPLVNVLEKLGYTTSLERDINH